MKKYVQTFWLTSAKLKKTLINVRMNKEEHTERNDFDSSREELKEVYMKY